MTPNVTRRLFGTRRRGDGGEHWLTIGDLFAGLMMVFLLIAVAQMRVATADRDRISAERDQINAERDRIGAERDRMRAVAETYRNGQVAIEMALRAEFKDDVKRWNAAINDDLTIEFLSPEVLFDPGKKTLRRRFAEILDDFYPRYLNALKQFDEIIDDLRVEGHTSSEWVGLSADDAYLRNMQLSQDRAATVLQYVYREAAPDDRAQIQRKVSAVGYGPSRLIRKDGIEYRERSRRVLFRVITNAESKIREILEQERAH